MNHAQDDQSRPPAPSTTTTTTTTTTSGPHTTTSTTHVSPGQGTMLHHDGPNSTTVAHPTVTTTTQTPPLQPSVSQQRPPQAPSYPLRLRSSSIRIRRPSYQPSAHSLREADPVPDSMPSQAPATENTWETGRRRSSSEPRQPSQAMFNDDTLRREMTASQHLQPLYEDGAQAAAAAPDKSPRPTQSASNMRKALNRSSSAFQLRRNSKTPNQHMMDENVVDVLDVIDPEISTLTTLNNVQNSLFLPNLPWLYNRQPTYELRQSSSDSSDEEMGTARGARNEEEMRQLNPAQEAAGASRTGDGHSHRRNSIDSVLSTLEEGTGHHYAVLPHGASLSGWTDEEKAILDDHVRHLLHSRRARCKRTMKGFGRYIRNPLGFIVTLYFFLITFWGAAWALFLIGWIYVGSRQDYFVEICDQILTALFCVVGITMFPFRLVDTYHMAYVAYYAHKTWRIRKERGLEALKDHNELPAMPSTSVWETGGEEQQGVEAPVLKAEEQKKLEYHQSKLEKSHTFYRPHETYTHHAFSIRLLITIIVLLDFHSMFQCALGGTTWGIYYKDRPKEVTAIILTCSLTCNISAGIIIGQGDRRSRKKLIVEQMLRQDMTEEALKKLKKERGLKAQGLMTRKQKQKLQKDMGEQPKNPLDTILHRG